MAGLGRIAIFGGSLLLLLVVAYGLHAQGRDRFNFQLASNLDYTGPFIFTRIRYGSATGEWGFRRGRSSWSHDYPGADRHLPQILHELTTVHVSLEGSNVLTLDDPALFKYPFIYLSEPGYWSMSDLEVESLRTYLLKGGFVIFDDFENEEWYNFEAQIKRVLPEYRLIELDLAHPIFHCFFEMKTIDFPHPYVAVSPTYYGIFEDDDPRKRMLAIVNYNNDVAEYWEWSDTGFFPVDITNEAYKLGVNYVVYSMTH